MGSDIISVTPHARSVPLDNADNDYDAESVQDGLEEIDFRRITKEPTGFVDRFDSTMSFTDGTRTFSITPTSTSYDYYIRGKRYTKDALESVVIPDTEGLWFIYFDGDTLTASLTPWGFEDPYTFIAIVYWDATNNLSIIFGEERHGLVMDWGTHAYLHDTFRTQVERNSFRADNYILDGDGSLDAHAQLSFDNGIVHDEDIRMPVVHADIPSGPFEQVLFPVGKIPVYYRAGTKTTTLWRKINATNFALYSNSPNTAFYNKLDISDNWTLVNATDSYYIVTWILATNNIFEPLIAIIGDNEQQSLIDAARFNVLSQIDLPNLPFVKETKFMYRLTWQTSTAFTNTPKAVLRSVASDVSDIIEAADGVTPPFVFSRSGNLPTGSYLYVGNVISSNAGQIVKGENYAIELALTARNAAGGGLHRVQFQRRTAITTFVDIPNLYIDLPTGDYRSTRGGIQITVGPDWELSAYVSDGSFANPIVIIYFIPKG